MFHNLALINIALISVSVAFVILLYNRGTKYLSISHSSRKKIKYVICEMLPKAHNLPHIHHIWNVDSFIR